MRFGSAVLVDRVMGLEVEEVVAEGAEEIGVGRLIPAFFDGLDEYE